MCLQTIANQEGKTKSGEIVDGNSGEIVDGNAAKYQVHLVSLCKRNKVKGERRVQVRPQLELLGKQIAALKQPFLPPPPPSEAFRLLKDAKKNGVQLGPSSYDHVIRKLLSEGSMEDAMEVKKL